ncbi:hypothetical protein ABXK36_35215, partial [Bacillus cereus]
KSETLPSTNTVALTTPSRVSNLSSNVKVLVGPEQLEEFFNKFVFHGRIQYNVDDLQDIMDKIESFN